MSITLSKNFLQSRNDSLTQLRELKPSNISLFSTDQITENFTLVFRPDNLTVDKILKLYSKLQLIEPNQFYYPSETLHLTLIGNLPINLEHQKIITSVERVIKQQSYKFKLYGLGSNNYCSSISAYPINFSLHSLRQELRNRLGTTGDNYSSILQSYEYMGWINYLRYLNKPSQQFLDKLYSYNEAFFGEMIPETLELYKNTSKVLAPTKAHLLHSFKLK